MRIAKILAVIGFIIMFVSLTYGFTVGDFNAEGAELVALIWGKISLIDVYIMFLIFWGWIVYREKSALRSGLWLVAMLVLGSLTACAYLFLALQGSGGDWKKFWLGQRYQEA